MSELDVESDLSEPAAAMSAKGAKRGGDSRAAKLTPAERSDIARQAAHARWGNAVPAAPYIGELRIGDRALDCAVLEGGQRLINQTTMQLALDRTGGARRGLGARSLPLLSALNLQKFVTDELRSMAESPIPYRLPGGSRSIGYPAEILPLICDVYLEARKEQGLTKNQMPIANAAELLLRGLARIGILALVDEATGYQEVRARNELQLILEAYVSAELRPWTKRFPDEFFQQIYRLQGWEYRPGTAKRTPYVGHLVNKYVYEQLPPGVLDEMRRLNPRNESGNRPRRFHQFLTADTGNHHLDKQISTVTTLMRISNSNAEFKSLFDRAFSPPQQRLPLIIDIPAKEAEPDAIGATTSPSRPRRR